MTLLDKAKETHNTIVTSVADLLFDDSPKAAAGAITLMLSGNTLALLALGEEQRTANIIAFYSMPCDMREEVQVDIATRLGLL